MPRCAVSATAAAAEAPQPVALPSPPAAPSPDATRRELRLAVLSGLLYVASFPGYGFWPLALVAWVPLMLAVRGATVKRALRLGAVAGFTSHLFGYYWIAHMLKVFAGLPWPAAALGMLGFAVLQGTSFGVGAALARWLSGTLAWPLAATLPVGLVAMDFAYPLIFPSYVGNSLTGATWLVQTADLLGVLGVTAFVGVVNGAIADWVLARREGRPRPRRMLAVVLLVVWTVVLYGALRTAQVDAEASEAERLKVGLVQVNVGGFENTLGRDETLQRYRDATRELHRQGAELVLWPEGALRGVVRVGNNVRDGVLDGLAQPLVFGATRVDRDATGKTVPYNSAFLAEATGEVTASYDKSQLLVFGEYIPLGETFPKIYDWLPMASHWGRGTSLAPLVFGHWRLGTIICYEDILPRFVREVMEPHGGRRPDLLVNVTNDSWYGDTVQPMEHLALAAFRSIEHRRALVRSTNTGISAIVDPAGRIVSRTRQYREETLLGSVPKMEGTTVYELVGDVLGWVALGIVAFAAARSRLAQLRRG